jgi:cobalamin biosynthesis protein CbiG
MSDTAISPAGAAAEDAGAAAEVAGAAAEEAGAAADEDSLDEEPELHAARVTEATPITAMAVTARPRVKRFDMWCPFKGWLVVTRRPFDMSIPRLTGMRVCDPP